MRFKMTTGALLSILISLFVIGACVHKPETFSMNIVHNEEDVYFEQSVFSRGSGRYKMGNPDWGGGYHKTFKFSFELDDISSLSYAYLSIESWDVDQRVQPIMLNDEIIGYLGLSVSDESVFRNELFIPSKLEATQLYLPKKFFKQGKNTLRIEAAQGGRVTWTDSFVIGRLDIVVIKVKHGLKPLFLRKNVRVKR